ncbi:MAG: ABC transporter permease [Deltaproteobacteria bacterium]|nr:ABC transporter permease [Deltaproteobacteria bacterium]MCX7953035.1 ABC transporter permease [Deltaproteobacteria bacterium]
MLKLIGRKFLEFSSNLGKWVLFTIKLIVSFDEHSKPKNFLEQIVKIGTLGFPVVAFMSVFVGGVMAVQSEYTLRKFGAEAFTGSAVALAVIRELSPVLTALLVIGRSGSAITAEIGVMKITEQIDALKSLRINVFSYLYAPRFWGFTVAVPVLTGFSMSVAVLASYLLSVNVLGLSSGMFINQMHSAVEAQDIISGLLKGLFFGMIGGIVSVYKGSFSEAGSQGVNKATTECVVLGSILVLVLDFILTSLFLKYLF